MKLVIRRRGREEGERKIEVGLKEQEREKREREYMLMGVSALVLIKKSVRFL